MSSKSSGTEVMSGRKVCTVCFEVRSLCVSSFIALQSDMRRSATVGMDVRWGQAKIEWRGSGVVIGSGLTLQDSRNRSALSTSIVDQSFNIEQIANAE